MGLRVVWLVLYTAALVVAEPRPVGPELLANGGFEQEVGWVGSAPADWGDCAGSSERVQTEPHAGANCMEVRAVRLRYMVGAEQVPAEEGQAYLLTAWIRTELAPGESAYLVAGWLGERGWIQNANSRRLTGRQPWTLVAVVLEPQDRPGAARRLQISFRVESSSGAGRAWVDDVSLRAAELPPPPSLASQEQRRQGNLAWSLLRERTALLTRRHALRSLRQRLEDPRATDLRLVWSRAATNYRNQAPRSDELDDLADLPRLRDECLAELEAIWRLKRGLTPERRRAYLRQQIRDEYYPGGDHPAADAPDLPPGGDGLLDLVVRTGLQPLAKGWLTARATLPEGTDEVVAVLRNPNGLVTGWHAWPAAEFGSEPWRSVDMVTWFPDYPYRYDLTVAARRGGEVLEQRTVRVAFREIAIGPSDVSATMRHAWNVAPADWTIYVNGQPFFLRGTVCNDWSRYPAECAELFDELWLQFQRTYGNTLAQVSGPAARTLGERGVAFLASIQPDYNGIRQYVSRESGLEALHEQARAQAGLAADPAVLAVQLGNEEELAVWGADLPSVYGTDLWQIFDDVADVVRTDLAPDVPLSYVRAATYNRVLPVPGEDYSGINQYTGRYWGTRRTIGADLSNLGWGAIAEGTPFGVTEWNGPKYSWATSGISGVDEEGAAAYLYEYWRRLNRAPATVLSTEFVLNWVCTPVEDLTTVPLEEGLRRRAAWEWSLQQGTPWYPRIFPDLLTDAPARRAMQGFQSPLYELIQTPGPIVIGGGPAADALVPALRSLGRDATRNDGRFELDELDANLLLVGRPEPDEGRPSAMAELERRGVIGPATNEFPGPGRFLIQRRVNPFYPDRFLVALTASDAAGLQAGLDKLLRSADGLREALEREARQRRMLLLVDRGDDAWDRYVADLPGRGWFAARDDIYTSLDEAWLADYKAQRDSTYWNLGLIVVAVARPLSEGERGLLLDPPCPVVWSAATLAADPELARALGLAFGGEQSLAGPVPVADGWRRPLQVANLGDVRTEPLQQFGGLNEAAVARATTLRELIGGGWEPVAVAGGRPVAVARDRHLVLGADLSAAASALWNTTHRGVNHALYDRETASGLERLFRLLINAGAREPGPRPERRLHAEIVVEHLSLEPDEPLTVEVLVRDQEGRPAAAAARVGLASPGGNYRQPPERFRTASPVGEGRYRVAFAPEEIPAPGRSSYRGMTMLGVFASVEQENSVGDWTATTVRIGSRSDEPARLAELVRRTREGIVGLRFSIADQVQYVELQAELLAPAEIPAGRPAELELSVLEIENEGGNDSLEELELVLASPAGEPVVLPLAPGRVLANARAKVATERPEAVIVVDDATPARLMVTWPNPTPGDWRAALRYRYTDDYRIATTNRLAREDWLRGPALTVR